MPNFYFTFGSHPAFPYGREDFIQVIAPTFKLAAETYRKYHPDRPESPGILNCSDLYPEAVFNKFRNEYYPDKEPVEVLTWQE
jgi:hypothetical protein